MKRQLTLVFATAIVGLIAACSGNSSNNAPAAADPATSLDGQVAQVSSACVTQALPQYGKPAGSTEVPAEGSLNGKYEFADSKLFLVSKSTDGSHAVALVSTRSNGDGTYSNNLDCHDVVTAGGSSQSMNGDLSTPIKIEGDGQNATATGFLKVSASKDRDSDDIQVASQVDAASVQHVTKDQMKQTDGVIGKSYLTSDGLVVVMRFKNNATGGAFFTEYMMIHYKRVN